MLLGNFFHGDHMSVLYFEPRPCCLRLIHQWVKLPTNGVHRDNPKNIRFPVSMQKSQVFRSAAATSPLWVKNNLYISIDALIKFFEGIWSLRKWQSMRNDLTRFGTTDDNQIAQLGVVALIMITA
jgi:hypothetical protein